MLPSRIYESLPYAYVAIGVMILFSVHNPFAFSSALVFIAIGAVVWVVRSNYRRIEHRLSPPSTGPMPFWCYELLPFSYLTLGMSLWAYSDNTLMYPSALVLTVVGLQVWYLRGLQRRSSKVRLRRSLT